MRRSSLTLLCITLLLMGGVVSAAESQHSSADGSATCPDSSATASDRSELGDADPAVATVAPVRHSEKAKSLVTPRSNSGNRATAPRWHSFLPGMFR